ncbi:unnamed protein product [Chrysoparadoxa australica]
MRRYDPKSVLQPLGEAHSKLNDLAVAVMKYEAHLPEEEVNNLKKEVESLAEEQFDAKKIVEDHVKAIDAVSRNIQVANYSQLDAIESIKAVEDYSEAIAKKAQDLRKEGVQDDPTKDERYKAVMRIIKPDEAMDEDEDLVVMEGNTSLICVLTSAMLEEPVKSTICGHVFSKKAMMRHIQVLKGNAPCPVGGCSSRVRAKDLEPDKEMESRIRIAKRVESQTQQSQGTEGEVVDTDDDDFES